VLIVCFGEDSKASRLQQKEMKSMKARAFQ